ncbi:hypothetical protein NSERKGN1266_15410 [Nocardia seriolae]|nr:hypothetical protein NSERKGN1266_15410 [Nocardia seriolae]GEM24610.1 hypothetical protein NS2_28490 [Nocardia seriolae NBRC 15557]
MPSVGGLKGDKVCENDKAGATDERGVRRTGRAVGHGVRKCTATNGTQAARGATCSMIE